jgi:acyl carrier protein
MSPETDPGASVDERVTDVILSLCPIDPPPISDELFLTGDLGFDSLGLLELVSALEVEFDLSEVPEEEALEIETVGDLRALLAASTAA